MKKNKKSIKVFIWLLIIITAVILVLAFNNVIMPVLVQRGNEITIPDLTGMNKEEAIATLTRTGLQPGEIRSVPNDTLPPNRVIAHYPRAGRRVKPGRKVDLDISSGSNMVRIPNLEGLPLTHALTTLQRLGFVVTRIDSIRSTMIPAGRVVAAVPPFGTEVRQGSEISLSVSTKTGTFPMPNLVGLNIETARGIIANHGLNLTQLKYAVSSEPTGTVLFQYPEEGMPVAAGDTVSLLVAGKNSQTGQ
jgi:serine/threonine-protein kinase